MNDLVQRLRNYIPGENDEWVPIRMKEAADEIDRLNKLIERMARESDAEFARLTGVIFDLTKENERLRAIVRINGLRWGFSDAEIDSVLDGKPGEAHD